MSDLRVTVENGTVSTYTSAGAAVRALLPELSNRELQDLKLTFIHREQMRRTADLPDSGPVGSMVLIEKPPLT